MEEKPVKGGTKVLDLDRARSHKKGLSAQELRALAQKSGSQLIESILNAEDPRAVVHSLSPQDFYWIIKKVGEEDSLALLELGRHEQWQHVMDLELWERDRLDLDQAFKWLSCLHRAHPPSLARWLFTKAQHLAYLFFYKSIDVEIRPGDEAYELPDGFFTFDGVFYVRAKDPEQQQTLYEILRAMADVDYELYQSFLTTLSGVLPAELEEEMFRLRGVRLAEVGFLPFDEAMEIYSGLPLNAISPEEKGEVVELDQDEEEIRAIVPVTPLYQTPQDNMLMKVASKATDRVFLERLQLEFAGLCNQILSADGLRVEDFEVLVETCKRAAAYLNLALTELAGQDLSIAERVVRNHSLLRIFRVGFGLALKVKWEAERWIKESWFLEQGLDFSFWGDKWGGILASILEARPRYFVIETGQSKDFEHPQELRDAWETSAHVRVLDSLLRGIAARHRLDPEMLKGPEALFHPLLLNLWAVSLLGLEPQIRPLTLDEARRFLEGLREGEKAPPYSMDQGGEAFVEFFITQAGDGAEKETLSAALATIWDEFRDEYANVEAGDLDPRYSKFVLIKPSP